MREIKFRAWDEATQENWEVQTLSQPTDGRGAHNFKGYEKRNGYIARKVLSHPRADGRNYVLEHRLVMEQHLGRFLKPDEIVHHKNHVRDDNRVENLEVLTDQKRHAEAHTASMERNEISQQWTPDPKLANKKFRLFNRDTGLMEIKNLSQLINTTFRKSKFEYRGESTGLKDKNGKEIYEGDRVRVLYSDWPSGDYTKMSVDEYKKSISQYGVVMFDNRFGCAEYIVDYEDCKDNIYVGPHGEIEVIGNIYETPQED